MIDSLGFLTFLWLILWVLLKIIELLKIKNEKRKTQFLRGQNE